MAGGMNSRRGSGIPLRDRVAARPLASQAPPAPRTTQPTNRSRHCWVEHPELGRLEGLLLGWSDTPDRALVVYVDNRGAAVTTWVPASAVSPAL